GKDLQREVHQVEHEAHHPDGGEDRQPHQHACYEVASQVPLPRPLPGLASVHGANAASCGPSSHGLSAPAAARRHCAKRCCARRPRGGARRQRIRRTSSFATRPVWPPWSPSPPWLPPLAWPPWSRSWSAPSTPLSLPRPACAGSPCPI